MLGSHRPAVLWKRRVARQRPALQEPFAMPKRRPRALLFQALAATALLAGLATAADLPGPPPGRPVAVAPAPAVAATGPAAVAAKLGVPLERVTASPVPGFFQVRVGSRIVYVSTDARYLVRGELVDLTTNRDVAEDTLNGIRRGLLAGVSEASMIIFAPARYTDTVTVFTDITCGYCRKLHQQIADYNARGIRVRYLAFPRAGAGSLDWKETERVWCSADRRAALTQAKLGKKITAPDCKAGTVAQHFALGREFGLDGTPAIVLESGELIGGYMPPDELAKYLAESKAPARLSSR
jgi:thiol:disulfide interchange protein DsbC